MIARLRWLLGLVALTTLDIGSSQGILSGTPPVKLFIEAESFQFAPGSWQVTEDLRGGFQPFVPSGLKALSGAPAGAVPATKAIVVPRPGTYKVWVRFGQIQEPAPQVRGPFRVTLRQGSAVLFDQEFDTQPTPATGRYNPLPVWQGGTATLAAGPATLALAKTGAEPVDPRARRVDCLLLTDDPAYVPNHRDFTAHRTWVRFRLISSTPDRVYFHMFADHMREPWYEHMSVSRAGLLDTLAAPQDSYLAPGEASPWVDLTPKLYDESDTNFSIHATVRYRSPDAAVAHYAIDFATVPAEAAIVKTIERGGKGSGIGVRVPPDLSAGRRPTADYEYAAATRGFTRALPPVPFGRRPQRFSLLLRLDASENDNAPSVYSDELATLRVLGVSGVWGMLNERLDRSGIRFGGTDETMWYMGQNPANGAPSFQRPEVARIEAAAKAMGAVLAKDPYASRYRYASLMDEAVASDLVTLAADDVDQQAFRKYVRSLGVTVKELGVPSEAAIRIVTTPAPNPRLYYYSQRYRAHSIASFFKLQTGLVRRYFPPGMRTTQNFSDGAVYTGSMYSQGNDYYEYFKNEALDLAWSEDWGNEASTYECSAWNVALLRSATKYRKQPIGMHVITSYGRTPADVKLKAVTAISEGAKLLYFFAYSFPTSGHEPGWYENRVMFPALAELTREVGAVEDLLLPALPRKPETAIIYSTSTDIWAEGHGNTLYGMERMHTYLALRHAQVPVDIVSADDAIQGGLKGYRVAYLFGPHLKPEAARRLLEWTRAGGRLVVTANAATRDPFDQPMSILEPALGVTRAPAEEPVRFRSPGRSLPLVLKPLDRVIAAGGLRDVSGKAARGEAPATFDVLGARQKIAAAGTARILATFKDGTPAATVARCGKGTVTFEAFLPAVSYISRALSHRGWDDSGRGAAVKVLPLQCIRDAKLGAAPIPMKEYSYNPWEYDAAQRAFIVAPAAAAARPVACDRALIEATSMESPAGLVVPLANYGLLPIAKLGVTIAVKGKPKSVSSSRHGKLRYTVRGGRITLSLPLETTDFIAVRY